MAKARSIIDLRFPVGGLNRAAAFQSQPPYTTPYVVNCRPFDLISSRQRGGARPGLSKYLDSSAGTGPFQLLTFAPILKDGVPSYVLVAVLGGTLYQNASGSLMAVSGDLNASVTQLQATSLGQKLYIADTREDLSGSDGTITGENDGDETYLSDSSVSDWTTLGIDTAQDYVWISGARPEQGNIFPILSVASDKIRFYSYAGAGINSQAGGATWQIGRLPKVFDPANPTAALSPLMDSLPIPLNYYDQWAVTVSGGTVTLNTVAGDPDSANWSTVPQPTDDNNLSIAIDNLSGIGQTSYKVNTISAAYDEGTSTWTCTATISDTTVSYTQAGYAISWDTGYFGVPPLNCNLCCNYRGRLVLAGPGAIWYMSRVGDVNDWDYGYDSGDPSRAVGGVDTPLGEVPANIVALIPHSNSYLILGCEESLWIIRGDPGFGGSLEALSRDIGILGPNAWCNMPDGSLMILSRDGLYQIPAGASSVPVSVSRSVLPAELLNVDYVNNAVSLAYSVRDRGVHIFITPKGP